MEKATIIFLIKEYAITALFTLPASFNNEDLYALKIIKSCTVSLGHQTKQANPLSWQFIPDFFFWADFFYNKTGLSWRFMALSLQELAPINLSRILIKLKHPKLL